MLDQRVDLARKPLRLLGISSSTATPIRSINLAPECIRTVNVTPLGGSQEQTMSTIDRLIRRAGRLDPGAAFGRWWRRLFRGARNGLPA